MHNRQIDAELPMSEEQTESAKCRFADGMQNCKVGRQELRCENLVESASYMADTPLARVVGFAVSLLDITRRTMSQWHVVPDEWKPRLRAYIRATCGEDREKLSAYDFPSGQSVHLTFADGSFASFRFAFAVLDETGERCMVFTEHCGYHVFPVGSGGVQVTRNVRV